jgi:ABC-2 type transport system permease protein
MSASLAVLRTEAKLFAREPGTLFWVLLFPPLLVVGFGLIPAYQEVNPELGGRRINDVSVPSIVLVGLLSAGLRAMPARPAHLLAAQLALHALAVVLSALLGPATGYLIRDVTLPRGPLAYAVVLAPATAAGLATGAVITAVSRTGRAATAVGPSSWSPSRRAGSAGSRPSC